MNSAASTFRRHHKRSHVLVLAVTATFFAACPALAGEGARRKAKLLYLVGASDGPAAKERAACDRLTVRRYRERGVEVIERTPDDVKKWLTGDGKAYADADDNFRYLAFARAVKADAVGGLSVFVIDDEMAEQVQMPPGPSYIHGWGISLSGYKSPFYMDASNGMKVSAIPLRLDGSEGDPWAVPLDVVPKRPVPGDSAAAAQGMRGLPFLGVTLDGRNVKNVTDSSPAKEAGLQEGDEIMALGGKAIDESSGVGAALQNHKPGDRLDLEFRHNGQVVNKQVILADRFELFEIKLSQVGKPLPDLIGKDINGKEVRLHAFRGKIVLLDFWATWCGPCIAAMPVLQLLWERTKAENFAWISVSGDEDAQAWKRFVRNNHLGGIQLRDAAWAEAMHVGSYPTILLVDSAGIVQAKLRGDQVTPAVLGMLGQ